MAHLQFRDVVKKYAPTDQALGVPGGEVGGIPVPSPEDFATAEQGAKADTAVQPDDLGAAASMSPVEVVTDPDAHAALSGAFAPLAAGIEGTGMPQGVVTAPVGTVYRDLARTNGAVVWVKASGTGNTGWRVVWGDTDWRSLSEWDASGAYLPGMPPLLEPFTPRVSTQGGWIRIRRIGHRVLLMARNIDATVGGGTDNPLLAASLQSGGWPGFAPVNSSSLVLAPSQSLTLLFGFRAYGGNLRLITQVPVTVGNVIPSTAALAEFETIDAWPTVLPGAAA